MKRCIIFSAGTFFGLRQRPVPDDYVIAADAGYLACLVAGVTPDLLLGDFDSLERPKDFENIVSAPREKDDTDTMLAVRAGLEQGCDTFYFYGATGGKRLDHTLANLQTLLWLRRQGARGYIYGDDFIWTVIENESITIQKTLEEGIVSVFSMDGPARGVTETGLHYALTDADLAMDQPVGVSNQMEADVAEVSVREGALLVGWELPPLK